MDPMDKNSDTHDEKSAVKRRDDALRRALKTPPKPKQESGHGKPETKKEKPDK
jgi:hypothetical protein